MTRKVMFQSPPSSFGCQVLDIQHPWGPCCQVIFFAATWHCIKSFHPSNASWGFTHKKTGLGDLQYYHSPKFLAHGLWPGLWSHQLEISHPAHLKGFHVHHVVGTIVVVSVAEGANWDRINSWKFQFSSRFDNISYLVDGFKPSEKYESQLGWWASQYMEKSKMFQTTNQHI